MLYSPCSACTTCPSCLVPFPGRGNCSLCLEYLGSYETWLICATRDPGVSCESLQMSRLSRLYHQRQIRKKDNMNRLQIFIRARLNYNSSHHHLLQYLQLFALIMQTMQSRQFQFTASAPDMAPHATIMKSVRQEHCCIYFTRNR